MPRPRLVRRLALWWRWRWLHRAAKAAVRPPLDGDVILPAQPLRVRKLFLPVAAWDVFDAPVLDGPTYRHRRALRALDAAYEERAQELRANRARRSA